MFGHTKTNMERVKTTAHHPGTRDRLIKLLDCRVKTHRRKYCLHARYN